MKRILIVFISLVLLAGIRQYSFAMPANLTLLNDVTISSSVDNTKIELKFEGKRQPEKIMYQNDFIQIEFPDTYTTPPKQWHKVEDDFVKNIFVYQFDTTTVRVRLFSYDKAGNLKDRINIGRTLNGFVIQYAVGAATSRDITIALKKGSKKNSAVMIKAEPPVEVNALVTTDSALSPHASESSVEREGMANQDETGMSGSLDKDLTLQREGDGGAGLSPDVIQAGQSSKTSLSGKQDTVEHKITLADNAPGLTGSVLKMVTALGIVLSLLFAGVYLAKKFLGKKIGFSGQEQKIKVVTSTYLGPKKSIALVEVAGEKIVVGVTATNISMLTKIGKDEDFREVLKEQIKSSDEKVEIQDELWDDVKA